MEKVLPDFRGYSPSADMGIEAKGFVDANHVLGYTALIGNGTGQKTETNRQKRVSGSLPIRWKDFHVEPYVDYESIFGGNDRLTADDAGLRHAVPRRDRLGGDEPGPAHAHGPYKELRGQSFFLRVQPKEVLGAFVRVDLFAPNHRAANRVDQQLYIAGIDWQPFKDVHIMPNIESMQYTAKGTGLVPPHHDLQARITFFWKFARPQS
jgi:hypothetical protein